MQRKPFLFFISTFISTFTSLSFTQELNQPPSLENINPVEIEIKQMNFQAGKKVINLQQGNLTLQTPKKIIKPKEFEENPYKEIVKHYAKYLSKISSEELDKLIRENLYFYAIYKANFYNLGLLTYETTKDLPELINNIDYYKMSDTPMVGKTLKIAWIKKNIANNKLTSTNKTVNNNNTNNEKMEEIYLEGYCVFPQTIKIYSSKPFYSKVLCTFNNENGIERGVLWGAIIPDFQNEMVYFKPLKLISENGKKFKIKEAVVLNAQQTSPNIATSLNKKELEKILAKAGLNTAKDVKEAIKEKYLEGNNQELYVQGDMVIKQNNYALIDIKDFAIKDAITNLMEAGMEILNNEEKEIRAVFTIEKGATIYVNLVAIPLSSK